VRIRPWLPVAAAFAVLFGLRVPQAAMSVSNGAPPATPGAQSDLDAFMERVIARRDENWKKLQQYILDERETFQLTGPDGGRLYGFEREYTWFIRQGYFVRSPLKADGVRVSEDDRAMAERRWIAREHAREKRRAQADANRPGDTGSAPPPDENTATTADTPSNVEDVLKQSLEPRFVSAAYFLRFKFDPGHYALAGRERLADRDVLRVEYYPSKLFSEGRTRPNKRIRDKDDEIEEKMNKVSLVTLWIDPTQHQIIQYTFDNMDFDFLPGRSIVRIDDLRASMRMAQPFPDVWLPSTIAMRFRMTMAIGSIAARYDVEYHDYRLAEVTTRIKGNE
jgi:hypothetical protein